MGSKVIVFLLAMVLLISTEVAGTRKLAQTSNTANTFNSAEAPKIIIGNPLDPNKPFCNRSRYGQCIGSPPKNTTKPCKYKNKCTKPPAIPNPK